MVKKKTGGRRLGAGRPKGAQNLVTVTCKENIMTVFSRIGGLANMARWAKENQTEFYKLYAKLLPKQIDAEVQIGAAEEFLQALKLSNKQ